MLHSLLSRLTTSSASRWLARVGRGRTVVLCYHDLCEPEDFSSWLRVEVGRFEEHIEALTGLGTFVAPSALERPDEQRRRDHLQLLLTFDDGYLNNLRLGADVLAKHDVPALFFVSTHHLVSGEPFWFDRVVTRVQVAQLERLDLSRFGLRDYRFFATDGARRWDDIQLLLSDLKRLGNSHEPAVARILDLLDSEYAAVAAPFDERLRPITVPELRQLASRPQAFFGSHGHHHAILPRLGDADLAANLTTSKEVLEKVLGRSIEDVAYPNGDEDRRVREACVRAGYRRGYVTTPGAVPLAPDVLRLPRVLVGGYDTARDVVTKVKASLLTTVADELFGRPMRPRLRGSQSIRSRRSQ